MDKQKIVVIVGAIIIAVMVVYPPWKISAKAYSGADKGYSLITRPPCYACGINPTKLAIQVAVVVMLCGLAYVMLGNNKVSSADSLQHPTLMDNPVTPNLAHTKTNEQSFSEKESNKVKPSKQLRYCAECGCPLLDFSKFCSHCGAKVL